MVGNACVLEHKVLVRAGAHPQSGWPSLKISQAEGQRGREPGSQGDGDQGGFCVESCLDKTLIRG